MGDLLSYAEVYFSFQTIWQTSYFYDGNSPTGEDLLYISTRTKLLLSSIRKATLGQTLAQRVLAACILNFRTKGMRCPSSYSTWRASFGWSGLRQTVLHKKVIHDLQSLAYWVVWIMASFNTVKPIYDGHHFPDDILKCIFLNENVWISLTISLKCVRKFRINNIPPLVQIMAWRRPGDKPLSGPMMVSLLTHICVTRPQCVNCLISGNFTNTGAILLLPQ